MSLPCFLSLFTLLPFSVHHDLDYTYNTLENCLQKRATCFQLPNLPIQRSLFRFPRVIYTIHPKMSFSSNTSPAKSALSKPFKAPKCVDNKAPQGLGTDSEPKTPTHAAQGKIKGHPVIKARAPDIAKPFKTPSRVPKRSIQEVDINAGRDRPMPDEYDCDDIPTAQGSSNTDMPQSSSTHNFEPHLMIQHRTMREYSPVTPRAHSPSTQGDSNAKRKRRDLTPSSAVTGRQDQGHHDHEAQSEMVEQDQPVVPGGHQIKASASQAPHGSATTQSPRRPSNSRQSASAAPSDDDDTIAVAHPNRPQY